MIPRYTLSVVTAAGGEKFHVIIQRMSFFC